MRTYVTLQTEIKVLMALGWVIEWITPWDFVQECVKKLDREGCPEEILREKCVSIMKEVNIVSYRPCYSLCYRHNCSRIFNFL
ncbi:hypothetical protein C1H46_002880 [Malus baccata]|uniref:Cyclin N-terminal domain-containing protein n=1 Tax=Malus baccata TaxID=106549 RepID=A0A540NKG0_MALBA|nr:hypothetical protein C1H46_002880 [Malus baccata]